MPAVTPCPTAAHVAVRRRHPEETVLHRLVRAHLETFLAEARARGGGDGLPRFVERELREFLSCGVAVLGFERRRAARLGARGGIGGAVTEDSRVSCSCPGRRDHDRRQQLGAGERW